MQRGPLRAAALEAPEQRPAPLTLPERLPPRRDLNEPVAASGSRPLIATEDLTVVVTGIDENRRAQLGVATFASVTGADFAWTPLTAGSVGEDGAITLHCVTPARVDIEITLSSAAQHARHAYYARQQLTAAARRDGASPTVTLAATIEEVIFELPESPLGQACRGPWRLLRIDDPRWLPQQLASTGIYLSGETPSMLSLGAGRYQLQDPLDPTRLQEFAVPGSPRVVLSAELAAPRAALR
ncbi:MAG: hypothetical protein H6838_12105 [Planctomycetes bacterium]|nr:hypothetical protein [Planctomycetota bacterium]MCB9886231.1 hypothetical protein [Planctomycetota bacterium]